MATVSRGQDERSFVPGDGMFRFVAFLMKSLAADLRLWAISGSQDLVQTAHLADYDLGRGPRSQCLGLGPLVGPWLVCWVKASRWCWSPGSRETLGETPDSPRIPKELFKIPVAQHCNLWPLGHYVTLYLTHLSALLFPPSARVLIAHEWGGGCSLKVFALPPVA